MTAKAHPQTDLTRGDRPGAERALVIDFERGLLATDFAAELFWAQRAARWAHLLAEDDGDALTGRPDGRTLPVRHDVMALAEEALSGGRPVSVIVRGGPEARAAAAELLPGARIVEADRAADRFDPGATLVGTDAELARAAGLALRQPAESQSGAGGARALIRALRPHQWLKNVLIFVPMVAAHALTPRVIGASVLAFIAFSLIASSVYVLNDLLDLAADRAHPRKRMRPFASGALPLATGRWLVPALLVAGAAVAVAVGPLLVAAIAAYYLVTVLYTFWLKRRAVIDICALAGLYTLRLVAGSAATGIALSVWLLAFSVFLFLALAAVKRQAELQDAIGRGQTLALGRGYRVEDVGLVSQMALSAGYVAVLVLALYLNSDAVQQLYSLPVALWGICLVLLYWLSRAVMKAHRGELHDDPLVFAVTDNVSRICIVLMLGFGAAAAVL